MYIYIWFNTAYTRQTTYETTSQPILVRLHTRRQHSLYSSNYIRDDNTAYTCQTTYETTTQHILVKLHTGRQHSLVMTN